MMLFATKDFTKVNLCGCSIVVFMPNETAKVPLPHIELGTMVVYGSNPFQYNWSV